MPDPGSRPVDCAAVEAGLEFAPFMIADFERQGNKTLVGEGGSTYQRMLPLAKYLYSYADGTAQVYAQGDGLTLRAGYEPVALTAGRCGGDSNNHVLHISGGPFYGWGGGIGVALSHLSQDDGLCPWGARQPASYCPPVGSENAVSVTTLDASQWDGVALWARRSPGSQPLLRVLVGNKFTDDDVSFLQYGEDPTKPRYCERVRECACRNGKACNYWGSGSPDASLGAGYYCGDPSTDPQPGIIPASGAVATNSCNITQCDDPYPAYPDRADRQFNGRPCTSHAFRNGIQSSFCFDPGRDPPDPPPADTDQQCGDHWTFPLHLTTDWQLYLVPFKSMYQQGFGKRWPSFDTTSVSVVRLTWDGGYIDYFIDNIRFYRLRRR